MVRGGSGAVKERYGFAGLFLILILGVAGLLLLYTMYADPFSPSERKATKRYSDRDAYPWDEGDLLSKKDSDGYGTVVRRGPYKGQPEITERLKYEVEVFEGGQSRGVVRLTVYKNGGATAVWEADFEIGGRHYKRAAKGREYDNANVFKGNIAPLKIYEDDTGKDESKLYVITSGLYHLVEVSSGEEYSGGGYVTAWIDKEYEAEGELAIPSFIDGKIAIFYWGPVELIID